MQPQHGVRPELRREVEAVAETAAGLFLYLSLLLGGPGSAGALLHDIGLGLRYGFGTLAWLWPATVVGDGLVRLGGRPGWLNSLRGWAGLGWLTGLGALASLVGGRLSGGIWGNALEWLLVHAVGSAGTVLVLAVWLLIALLLMLQTSLVEGLRRAATAAWKLFWKATGAMAWLAGRLYDWVYPPPAQPAAPTPALPEPGGAAKRPRRLRPPRTVPATESAGRDAAAVPVPTVPATALSPGAGSAYPPPPLSLLAAPGDRTPRRNNVGERAETLVRALAQFGIEVKLGEVSQGPTITRFEIIPPPGVKVSRIVNLADDIALSLAAVAVRIEAPIPGKSAVGIEVPNDQVTPVLLREVLESPAFAQSPSPLTVGLGKDVAGAPVVARLDQMPHLLVAGATGSGKSVLINVLISSLLFRAGPDAVRLLLIDPKVVELSVFNDIPHLLAPVVTDPKKAAGALRWAVKEMERRYRLFAEAGVRDVVRYNQSGNEPLPYIVIVIDELADLMMVAPQDVEESIARLAQMARAAGMHLVVATQRPSVDVITGTIKANIPSRIAFAVSSQVDSRTILDAAGAEKLLGRGDMLFSPVGAPKPQRLQGAFMREQEIDALVAYLRQIPPPAEPESAIAEFTLDETEGVPSEAPDNLFAEAVRIVVESRQASASMLQRRLRIGYARAARLIDAMEERGFVGRLDGAKGREVRLTREQFERLFAAAPDGPG